jgi:hypothetical protein
MREHGHYSWNDIPKDILVQGIQEIGHYTVSLVAQNQVIGSGTLIRTGSAFGILTAYHVARLIFQDENGVIGVNIDNRAHHFLIEVRHLQHAIIGRSRPGADESLGPDLSMLVIPDPLKVATISSKKSFFNVDRRSLQEFHDLPFQDSLWYIAGAPAELTWNLGEPNTPGYTLGAQHFVGAAVFQGAENRDPFDYVILKIDAGEEVFPSNYGGVSGGGIWLLSLTVDPDRGKETIDYEAPFLCGVAFFQGPLLQKQRLITGHGPKSLYEELRSVVTNELS